MSTIGEEKKFNLRFIKPREDFIKLMNSLNLDRPKLIGNDALQFSATLELKISPACILYRHRRASQPYMRSARRRDAEKRIRQVALCC
jgi:hypothetical protein